jgi:Zn finger protein HypA/HybF involved in hydrogenase expression
MSEVTAIRKFPCPACGAEAEWNPKKQKLVCPYCGAESAAPVNKDTTQVQENDLLEALKHVPDSDRGWETEKKTVRCQNCNAISVFDAAHVGKRCDFCGSPSLIAMDDIKAPIRPGAVLPFKIAQDKVRDEVRRWYGSHWFAPNALGVKALTDQVRGVYLPFWTFDAQVAAKWQAEAGHYYYVQNDKGEREQRVNWQYASGALDHFFDDVLVPASRGVNGKLLDQISPYPTTTDLVPYDPGYLSGWVVEQYQVDLPAATQDCRGRMENELRSMCASQIPGDTYRNLNVNANYSAQTYKHVLLPVWLLTYNYGAKTYQVVANGYTGKVAGKYPVSWIKVTIVVAVVLFIIVLYLLMRGHAHTSSHFNFN